MKVKLFMKKVITIIGIIIIIIGVSSMVLVSRDILAFGGFKTSLSGAYTSQATTSSGTSIYQSQATVLEPTTQYSIPQYYSSIRVYFSIQSSVPDQQFNISLGIIINQQNSYCATGELCFIPGAIKNGFTIPSPGSQNNGSVLTTERTLPSIPLIFSNGLQISSKTPHEYVLRITSTSSFSFQDQTYVKSRVVYPIALLFAIIGIIVTIIGVVLKPANGSKKLRKRSWQEPTLGGSSSMRNSRGSFRSSKSSKGGTGNSSAPKISSAVTCKKCGGIMPRNSQYCPHCYSKQ